jgi:hypothetical protein
MFFFENMRIKKQIVIVKKNYYLSKIKKKQKVNATHTHRGQKFGDIIN